MYFPTFYLLAIFSLLLVNVNGSTFKACSKDQQDQLKKAAAYAHAYASNAAGYLMFHATGSVGTPRYITWFGEFEPTRYTRIASQFKKIASISFASTRFDCGTCATALTTPPLAYVHSREANTIYLCKGFWKAPTSGSDSQAGALISAAARFNENGGAQNYAFGQNSSKQLAYRDPKNAIRNAPSFGYFAENEPHLV